MGAIVGGVRGGSGVARRRFAVRSCLALVVAVVASSCVPTSPGPSVLPQGPGRGKDDSVRVAPSSGCDSGAQAALGRTRLRITTAQGERSALLDVPASASGGAPAPLLLSLHPFSVGGAEWDGYSGMAAAATARGYVVLTPQGSEPGPRWAVPGGLATGADDLGFLSAALDLVEDTVCIDRNREFAVGFSAGAAMAQALSCTMPWRVAAVAASGGANLTELCPDAPATDVMVLHGTADPIAPITGSYVVFAPPLGLALDRVVATNAARAGCAPEPLTSRPRPSIELDRYEGCDDGVRVEHWSLLGAGHTWAGAEPGLDWLLGPTNQDVSATEQVLDFFDGSGSGEPG